MPLKYGIVGLPNVGKSTLFNSLSANAKAQAANYPFCTIEPNISIVAVKDDRMKQLQSLANSQKLIPATIEFVDIAGLVRGASKGEGLGNKFLANIREVDAIIHVIRCFEDTNIIHVEGKVDPVSDKEIIDYELQLKDLESVQKRIAKVEKTAKSGNKEGIIELDVLKKCEFHLEKGQNLRTIELSEPEFSLVYTWQLLTIKPVIYVANVDENTLQNRTNNFVEKLKATIDLEKSELIIICASLEEQLSELDADGIELFKREYNIEHSGLDTLVMASYKLLGLITYFTVGPQEVHAWTIKEGTKAPMAAGVIHSDFEKGFIKAEVIKYCDYILCKTEIVCKESGKISIEGKNYIVKDGDIMNFRFT